MLTLLFCFTDAERPAWRRTGKERQSADERLRYRVRDRESHGRRDRDTEAEEDWAEGLRKIERET